MRTFKLVRDLLTPSEKRKLLGLVPLMLAASVLELALVAIAAAFFSVLSDPSILEGEGRVATVFDATGLSLPNFLILFGTLLLFIVVSGNAFAAYANRRVYVTTWKQVVSLGERVLGSFLGQHYEFFLTESASDLAHRCLQDVQQVVNRVIVAGTLIGVRSMSALAVAAFLVWQEPLLTVILVGVVGTVYGGTFYVLRRWLKRLGRQAVLANRTRQRNALESLHGVKEVKLMGLEAANIDRFKEPSIVYADSMATQQTIATFTKYALEAAAIGGLVLVVVVFLSIGRPIQEILPVVATFAFATFRLLPTFQLMFTTASTMQAHAYALERVHAAIMEAPPPNPPATQRMELNQAIELIDVSYTYPTGPAPVVRSMNLELAKGSWTALVGTTGAGKSTLVDLVMGLLHPSDGEVRVDGAPLETTSDVLSWQLGIGYVPQSMFVTDDTITSNIAFGDPEPDLERMRRVADLAALADFVENELPEGYDTRVGDHGTRLSGGQRQRMAIARALYRSPDVLVLDEATSALDNRTEAQVMASLREHYQDTTVIMIAHRLTTTRHCDRILMLEHGRVVDEGTFDQLIERSAAFRRMVDSTEAEALQA